MASTTTSEQPPRGPKKRQRTRESPADTREPRKSRKRARIAKVSDDFYSVKSILDESGDKYLIDWEDDPVTGRSYTPTWEPKANANKEAVGAWEEIKRRQGDEPQDQVKETNLIDNPSDSEPIRIAKRNRNSRSGSEIESSISSPATKHRRLSTGLRQATTTSFSHGEGLEKDEIENNSDGEPDSSSIQAADIQIQVTIPFHDSIDSSAYANATSDSTQHLLSATPQTDVHNSLGTRSVDGNCTNLVEAEIPESQDRPTASIQLAESQNTSATQNPTSLEDNKIESHNKNTSSTQSFSDCSSSTEAERHQATSSEDSRVEHQHSLAQQQRTLEELTETTSSNSQSKQTLPSQLPEIPETPEASSQADRLSLTSAFEEIWQGAQVISPINHLSTPESLSERPNIEIFENNTTSSAQDQHSQGSADHSALSQQDGDLTKSFSQPEEPTQNSPSDKNLQSQNSISQSSHSQSTQISTTNTGRMSNEEASNFSSFLPPHLVPSSGLPDLPGTYGSNIPRRPRPLSSSNMSGGQDSMELEASARVGMQGLSVREQMRLRRAETAASRPISVVRTHSPATSFPSSVPSVPANPDVSVLASVPAVPSTRSASLTPARVPPPLLPAASLNQTLVQSNQMLPNRGVTAPSPHLPLNQRTGHNGPMKEEKDAEVTHSTELPRLGVMEYIVPLPMMSTIRKVYESTIRNNKHEIQEFTNNDMGDPQLVLKMEKMIDTLKKLGDHQEIDMEISPSQATMNDDTIKKWAETCSTKCAFIRELLDSLRLADVHVALLARPGRMVDILEAMIRSQKYIYNRPDQHRRSGQNCTGPLRVTLLPTGDDGRQYITIRADMVIAFDETFQLGEKYSGILRSGHHDARKLSPLIFLVITNSAEHLELCIPQAATRSRERTRALVNAIVEKRHEVGKLDGDLQPQHAAERVARYLTAVTSGSGNPVWPLARISGIVGIDFTGVQFRPDSSTPFSNQIPGHMQLPLVPRSSTKRSWDGSDTPDPDNKRARSTPVPGDTNASLEVSRVSDTVGSQSQIRSGPTTMGENSGATGLKPEYQDQTVQDAAFLTQIAALSSKVADLESQLSSKQQTISKLYKVIKERDHSIEVNIAPRYQEAIKEAAEARMKSKSVSENNEALLKRSEQRDAEIQKLKEEKNTIQDELNTARTALGGFAIPEVAELAGKNEEIRSLREALERQEKKTASAEKLNDFMRDQYQKASNFATDAKAELDEKDKTIVNLTSKADDNRVICAQAQAASEKKESDLRISELEALLQDREDELARKREELKFRSSRRETRGVSVPRSPAMNPSPRVAGSSRSRAGSPAVGDLGRERDSGDSVLGVRTRRIGQLLSLERDGA